MPEAKAAVAATTAVSNDIWPTVAWFVALATALPVEMPAVPVESHCCCDQLRRRIRDAMQQASLLQVLCHHNSVCYNHSITMTESIASPRAVVGDKTLGSKAHISSAAESKAAMGTRGLFTKEAGPSVSFVAPDHMLPQKQLLALAQRQLHVMSS